MRDFLLRVDEALSGYDDQLWRALKRHGAVSACLI